MTDTSEVSVAANELEAALSDFERAILPIIKRVQQLEEKANQFEAFEADRAELARKLDAAAKRESEFKSLAQETREELDRVIAQVNDVIGDA